MDYEYRDNGNFEFISDETCIFQNGDNTWVDAYGNPIEMTLGELLLPEVDNCGEF